jgi:hypothetical protein
MRRVASKFAVVILCLNSIAFGQSEPRQPTSRENETAKSTPETNKNDHAATATRITAQACADDGSGKPQATAVVMQEPAEDARDSWWKTAVPLFQSLVWALLIGTVLIFWRKEIMGALRGKHFRVKAMDFEIEVFGAEQSTATDDLPVETVPFF